MFYIKVYYKLRDFAKDFITIDRYNCFIYKKSTINLLKLLDN